MNFTAPRFVFAILFSVAFAFCSTAQSKGKMVQLKPINATGEVISVFEGTSNIALVKILKADTAKANFEITAEEVLCTFQFGTQASTGEPKLPGVKVGDTIRMEFLGTRNSSQEPWNYLVFRYWLVKEKSSSPKDEQSQK